MKQGKEILRWRGIMGAGLRGATMVEMLFVIILSAVIMMIVWDGVSLFGRYSTNMISRITANSTFFNDYSRLEALVSSADSIGYRYGWIELYRPDHSATRLNQANSSVVVTINGRTDTMFRSLSTLYPIQNDRELDRIDTLVIWIQRAKESYLKITLAPRRQFHQMAYEKLLRNEEKYRYE